MANVKKGWSFPNNCMKAHYFVNGQSLCGRWGYWGTILEDDKHKSPSNCKTCMKKRSKLYG